jgi:hypothetical protein
VKTSRVHAFAIAATVLGMPSLHHANPLYPYSPVPPAPPAATGIARRYGEIQPGDIVVLDHALTELEWDKVRAFVRGTSRESLRLRFGQAADFRDERTLKRLVDIDGASGEMIWMLEQGGAICAIAHLVRLSPEQAEVALMVRSDRVRCGIGERLLRVTLARAAQHDVKTVTALVLYETPPCCGWRASSALRCASLPACPSNCNAISAGSTWRLLMRARQWTQWQRARARWL